MEPENYVALLIQLINANAEKPCAYFEYAMRGKDVPADAYFVTVAAEAVRYRAAMAYRDGVAVPVAVTMRIRQHVRTDAPVSALYTRWSSEIRPALEMLDLQVSVLEQKDVRYDRTIDRFVRESVLTADGLLICLPDDGEGA